jgi:hypothetical protein
LRSVLIDGGIVGSTRAVHEVTAQTDANGNFAVDVYSADGGRQYTLDIAPPADSIFQTTSTTITVSGAPTGFGSTVTLERRPVVSGRVLDPKGVPLKGALVQPTTNDAPSTVGVEQATVNVQAKLSNGSTDMDGRFTFPTDAGTYTLGVIPPTASALPRLWLSTQTFSGDTDLGDITLPQAIEIDGIVVDNNTMPLVGADGAPIQSSVRLYLEPPGNYTCDTTSTDCLVAPKLQADSTTNKDGRAALLVASD